MTTLEVIIVVYLLLLGYNLFFMEDTNKPNLERFCNLENMELESFEYVGKSDGSTGTAYFYDICCQKEGRVTCYSRETIR